jgi:site-specific DNA-methyltransferase (adenine-specific)
MNKEKLTKVELYHDHFQNYKRYNIPKAQLVIADIPYNLGNKAYASSPSWYIDGDNAKGESQNAGASFFDTDKNFNIVEYMHFCSTLLIKEPKEPGKAPCMIIFCAFEQMHFLITQAAEYGFKRYIPLVFIKNYSSQVLKANMRVVGATEYALVFYRDKLPKFNNNGKMVFNWFNWDKDQTTKIHPTQKPLNVLKELIEIFTDPYDVVIDPVAGSGSTLRAAAELNRHAFGFEIKKDFIAKANLHMLKNIPTSMIL